MKGNEVDRGGYPDPTFSSSSRSKRHHHSCESLSETPPPVSFHVASGSRLMRSDPSSTRSLFNRDVNMA